MSNGFLLKHLKLKYKGLRYVYLEKKIDSKRTLGHLGAAPYTVEDGAPVDGLREMHRTIRTNGRYKSVPSLDPTCEETRNTKKREREKLLGGTEISSYTFLSSSSSCAHGNVPTGINGRGGMQDHGDITRRTWSWEDVIIREALISRFPALYPRSSS
ncbi:PREDICTED: uncharacterized protein LOC105455418 [Wasmannia auropunctata]|uniref:uncharacterized protein LOC105455418 n=1 Tax=Wasmannia auropunctata TaxID=64793 RepID=UPI0005EDC1A9|nr:PREDICTED: uncharacterized protein LOC105455418 [Wasmannia auropunctata]